MVFHPQTVREEEKPKKKPEKKPVATDSEDSFVFLGSGYKVLAHGLLAKPWLLP